MRNKTKNKIKNKRKTRGGGQVGNVVEGQVGNVNLSPPLDEAKLPEVIGDVKNIDIIVERVNMIIGYLNKKLP